MSVQDKLDETDLPDRIREEVEEAVEGRDVTEEQMERIIAEVEKRHGETRVDPLEPVGTVSAQSIGEPGTQMSLDASEEVVVRRAGETEVAEIGAVVDGLLKGVEAVSVDGHEVAGTSGLEVLSLRSDEGVEWKPVEEVSRHESPDELLRVELEGGRSVRATKNHSFVTRRDNEVVPVEGEELDEGDWIPVVREYDDDGEDTVTTRQYLPDGYWSTSALTDGGATAVSEDQARNRAQALEEGTLNEDAIYPVGGTVGLPAEFPLDDETGFFVGAYLAGGHATDTYVSVSNVDEQYLGRVREFASRFDLTTHEYKNGTYAEGRDLRLDGKVVADFVRGACHGDDGGKRVPEFAFGGPDGFVRGLLRGYLSGDGGVSDGTVRASSTDHKLVEDVSLLLARFGVHTTLSGAGGSRTLRVPRSYLPSFTERVGMVGRRGDALRDAVEDVNDEGPDPTDQIPSFGEAVEEVADSVDAPSREFNINSATDRQRIGRGRLSRLVDRAEAAGVNSPEVDVLREAVEGDVVWKRISSVESVEPTGGHVYDFSVAGLDTFTTAQGVVTHNTMNTFHYAGVAEIDVTQGLPRLIELVDARKEPDTPMMTVHLEDEYADDREKARSVVWDIEATKILSIGDISIDVASMDVSVALDGDMLEERELSVEEIATTIEENLGVEVAAGDNEVSFGPDAPSYRELLQLVEELREIVFKGIEGIERVVIRKEDMGDEEEYVLYTEGSEFKKVLRVDGVDATRTRTNNIHEMKKALGIEAARNAIIDEMVSTLEEQGLEVDIRHIMLVADAMTTTGDIESIGRHGISGSKGSVLSRAAFEVTVNHLLDAAVHGEDDSLNGVTENVIVGQPIKIGTGDVDLVAGKPTKSD